MYLYYFNNIIANDAYGAVETQKISHPERGSDPGPL